MDKQQLRAHFKALREGIPADERARIDTDIAERLIALPEFASADTVLAYLSFGSEVETRGVIEAAWASSKTVALPRCIPGTHEMAWYHTDSFEGLERSSLGVEEPTPTPEREIDPAADEGALVVVPGLTFDAQGYRLGYGGGFYDTFLARFAGTSVGLCREVQLSDAVPALDAHDLPVHLVVTERRTIRP